ncbi:hypothetical protein Tamer19_52100 [Cupriavidus sp. TA19]|nr:hypothetical protein Tamer19_52100 [Cupriavidus sp. TA19]
MRAASALGVEWTPAPMELVVDCVNYKGYDIYPVVYRYEASRKLCEGRPARTYSAAVVICVENCTPCSELGRVYPVTGEHWGSLGDAERAAMNDGIHIVDTLLAEGKDTPHSAKK